MYGFAILWDCMFMFCVTKSMAKNGSCLRSALSDKVINTPTNHFGFRLLWTKFQTICSFVVFFERQRPINGYGTVAFFGQLGNCNYSHWPQSCVLRGWTWVHVPWWSVLSQTYSVTNTQWAWFSKPMSGRQNHQRLSSCCSWSWWWRWPPQPSHCQPL